MNGEDEEEEEEEEKEEEEGEDNIQVSGRSMPPLGRLFSQASTIGGAFYSSLLVAL